MTIGITSHVLSVGFLAAWPNDRNCVQVKRIREAFSHMKVITSCSLLSLSPNELVLRPYSKSSLTLSLNHLHFMLPHHDFLNGIYLDSNCGLVHNMF